MDALVVLRRMREVIDEQGWTRGGVIAPRTGQVCLLAATYIAADMADIIRTPVGTWAIKWWYEDQHHDCLGPEPNRDARAEAIIALLAGIQPWKDESIDLTDWNDEKATEASVRELIDRTIARLENAHD